jgi:hypothetical protein
MKLFTIDDKGKFVQFREQDFRSENREIDLEVLLESNPEYFFEGTRIAIIGRQVTTNLNTFIDLLGIDENGNTVVVELKRDKTPRETLAQILEYASFVDNLDYDQLNEIYQNYSGEDAGLDEFHREYFGGNESDKAVSWNKAAKLVIVAQDITPEIKQTSLYLRKKGLDVFCLEFKYFVNDSQMKMISSDIVVGDEEFLRGRISSSTQLPKTDRDKFYDSLDGNGKRVFDSLFRFAESEGLMFRWGSKGFSLNVTMDNAFVGLCFGYPPHSVFKQSIYTGFEEIQKKVNNAQEIIDEYQGKIEELGEFVPAKSNQKWVITKEYSNKQVEALLSVLKEISERIRTNGIKQ